MLDMCVIELVKDPSLCPAVHISLNLMRILKLQGMKMRPLTEELTKQTLKEQNAEICTLY